MSSVITSYLIRAYFYKLMYYHEVVQEYGKSFGFASVFF